jgi:hypothetical protein
MGTGRHGQNWTAYRHTLEDALAVADLAYNAVEDPTNIRQEIIDTVTGEWRFRNIGDMGWSPPTGARAPDVDMDGSLSTGQQGRRSPEYEGDRRITEQADGTWGFYCPHSAGDTDVKLFPELTTAMSREDYRQVMSVNLDGPFFLSQAAIPHLLDSGGSIVNIASNSGLQGVPYSAAYSASKGAIVQLTRSLAVEYIKSSLRVNAIAPAGTNTNIALGASFPDDTDPELLGRLLGPRGLTEPEEVAALFAFLASDEARSVTGAVYTIDNGLTVS